MPPSYFPKDVDKVTTAVALVLQELGYTFCFAGEVACYYYGTTTVPSSIDVMVLANEGTVDDLKSRIVAKDTKFYVLLPNPSTSEPTDMYQVLYYWLTPQKSGGKRLYQPGRSYRPGRSYKIDLHFPCTMTIRTLPTDSIVTVEDRPLAPILPLILLQLQRWFNSNAESRKRRRRDEEVLAANVKEMLLVLRWGYPNVKLGRDGLDSWLPAKFIARGKRNVGVFLRSYPDTKDHWEAIGF
ncbi:hypothetical protein VNI00_010499 [Paramarasmius palmivorus]|uniref:Uncharacterized protein n=1 Tax=Paramarasmius palmivorus TaxID=297713 RepID=A0AAW0CM71_9AGAR